MKFVAFVVALTIAMGSFAMAANPTVKPFMKKNASKKADTSSQETLKMCHEGFGAMRAVRAARVAIFNGEPKAATKLLNAAQRDLRFALKEAPTFLTTMEASVDGKVVAAGVDIAKENWIPIDGQVTLSDTYVASPENEKHIKNANEHFKNGETKKAIEELHLASIDVKCTRVLMSLTKTMHCVADAAKLLDEQKYYEANLALKTAEDGLVIDTTNVFAVPTGKTEKPKEVD
jgi:hypothetical protein